MTTDQTIYGVPRDLLSDAFDELTDWKSPVAQKLRDLLDSPSTEVKDRCGVQMVDCPECTHQWDHFFDCGNKPAAQPQGEPVAYRCRHSATEPWFFSEKPGYWEWQALYAEQPAPVAPERPAHANPPPGTEPSGTHHDNDGLDEWRKP